MGAFRVSPHEPGLRQLLADPLVQLMLRCDGLTCAQIGWLRDLAERLSPSPAEPAL